MIVRKRLLFKMSGTYDAVAHPKHLQSAMAIADACRKAGAS